MFGLIQSSIKFYSHELCDKLELLSLSKAYRYEPFMSNDIYTWFATRGTPSVSMTSYGPWPSFNDKSWTPYPDLNDNTWTPYPYFNDKSWTPYPSFSDNRHEDFQEKGKKRGKSTFLKIFIMFIVILRWFYVIYVKMSRQCRVPLINPCV